MNLFEISLLKKAAELCVDRSGSTVGGGLQNAHTEKQQRGVRFSRKNFNNVSLSDFCFETIVWLHNG